MSIQEPGYIEDEEEGNIKMYTHGIRKETHSSFGIVQMKLSEAVLNVVNKALECERQAYDLVESHSCWRGSAQSL